MNERHDEARREIFGKAVKVMENFRAIPHGEGASLLILLLSSIILGFVLPTYFLFIPYGTDVYSHLFFTRIMEHANSLNDFYKHCLEKGYLRYDYPFGLWLFGSIVAKITGMNMLELAQNIPFLLFLILLSLYFSYAKIFNASRNEAILSVAFLISMPIICTGILAYSTSVFVESFILISFIYLMLNNSISRWKRYVLISLLSFTLCFTHTGTTMFLLFLIATYLLIYAALWGNLHKDVYISLAVLMFSFIIAIHLFPHVHPQYIYKGRILVSVGGSLSSSLHIPFGKEVSKIFYEQIFVGLNPLYVLLSLFSVYSICKLLIFMHNMLGDNIKKLGRRFSFRYFSVPIIGSIRHVPHTSLFWPFWWGPIHLLLAIIGAFKTNREGICLLLSTAAITILPGQGAVAALRSISYLFIIIPVLSSIGFYYVKDKVEHHLLRSSRKIFVFIALLIFFSYIVILPVIGNLYYHPLISGTKCERTGLGWLKSIGSSEERCAGYGYRHMIYVYGDKIPPSVTTVSAGSEQSRFIWDQYSACFDINGEKYARDLYATFGVEYLIVSKRTLRNFGERPERLMIDYNKMYDKVYSSAEYFSIYKYIIPPVHRTNINPHLNFADVGIIKDAGDCYLVDTGEYKVRIGKTDPGMRYIGNKTTNFLGDEGLYYDFLIIAWSRGSHQGAAGGWAFHETEFPVVILGENQIIYEAVLRNKEENWASLTVKYTFFKKAFKREIIISNDWVNDSTMDINELTMTFFSPMRYFELGLGDETVKKRTMYPCQDIVPINKIRFDSLFIHNENGQGIYVKFDNTCPYPNKVSYHGYTDYPYYVLTLHMKYEIEPAESMHVTQWISIGTKEEAKRNIERYTSVSLYPYPNGEIPLVLISDGNLLEAISNGVINSSNTSIEMLKDVKFTKVIRDLNESKIDSSVIVKEKLRGNKSVERIKEIKEIASEHGIEIGIMPDGYNLEAVRTLAEENFSFMISESIPPPFERYFQEGLRRPQMAHYHGEDTNLVLLPISLPTVGGFTYFYGNNYEKAWEAVIDSVIENEDLCLFMWNSDKAGRPEYATQMLNTIEYAKEKGMTFATPHEIAKHLLLLKNVFANVLIEDKKIVIYVQNQNDEAVKGITFKMKLKDNYIVKNGKIVRISDGTDRKIYYISVDLLPKETKIIEVIEGN